MAMSRSPPLGGTKRKSTTRRLQAAFVLLLSTGSSDCLSADPALSPPSSVVGHADEAPRTISLPSLLSTCVDACQRGCLEIRRAAQSDGLDRRAASGELPASAVEYKINGDPRSALTSADLASQAAILSGLRCTWPGLTIVAEEEVADDGTTAGGKSSDLLLPPNPLRRDLCPELTRSDADATRDDGADDSVGEGGGGESERVVPFSDVTVFVDPLDGTREFVEGRVHNVQVLIGIAARGRAVGGAVGVPFPADEDEDEDEDDAAPSPVIAYGMVGSKHGVGYHGSRRLDPSSPVHGGAIPREGGGRPLVVSGDVQDPVLAAAQSRILSEAGGGRNVLLGGTGQKCLAVAEGRADVALMNFLSSSWDTCAPEALVRAAGGEMTDLFGERIVYAARPAKPATFLNSAGVVASGERFSELHHRLCTKMRQSDEAKERLLGEWSLREGESIEDILERRRRRACSTVL